MANISEVQSVERTVQKRTILAAFFFFGTSHRWTSSCHCHCDSLLGKSGLYLRPSLLSSTSLCSCSLFIYSCPVWTNDGAAPLSPSCGLCAVTGSIDNTVLTASSPCFAWAWASTYVTISVYFSGPVSCVPVNVGRLTYMYERMYYTLDYIPLQNSDSGSGHNFRGLQSSLACSFRVATSGFRIKLEENGI